jgi:hypothetical protein
LPDKAWLRIAITLGGMRTSAEVVEAEELDDRTAAVREKPFEKLAKLLWPFDLGFRHGLRV